MTQNLKEHAQAYEPPQPTKNIAELDKVDLLLPIHEETVTSTKDKDEKGNFKQWQQNYLLLDEVKYRVPKSVIIDIKQFIEAIPTLRSVKISKSGSGMETRYTVIPLEQ